jgi:hypothetical protein
MSEQQHSVSPLREATTTTTSTTTAALSTPFVEFKFNGTHTHLACPVTVEIVQRAAFLIYVNADALSLFCDGTFSIPIQAERSRTNFRLSQGPILFLTERRWNAENVETYALFYTKQHYCAIEEEIVLNELDVDCFDSVLIERFFQTMQHIPSSVLATHEVVITEVATRAQNEALRRKQQWIRTIQKEEEEEECK